MLSGKPASIAAIWADPKLATRRAEDPKPKKAKKSKRETLKVKTFYETRIF